MASIFEHINHRTKFVFTFLTINLTARLIACHFFSCLFLWCYLKFIFRFIILVGFKTASYFESCNFCDLLWWLGMVKNNLARTVFRSADLLKLYLFVPISKTWATAFWVTSLDALGMNSRPWPGESWCWGSHLWDSRRNQTTGLGAGGRQILNHVLSYTPVSAVTSCVLPPVLSPPASDPFLKVLTRVNDDVLRGCKCCLSEGWCLIGSVAVTPSKLILLYSNSLVIVQPSSCWWATPLLCFRCTQGVGSIHFSTSLSLLPCLPAQCPHSPQFSWCNP